MSVEGSILRPIAAVNLTDHDIKNSTDQDTNNEGRPQMTPVGIPSLKIYTPPTIIPSLKIYTLPTITTYIPLQYPNPHIVQNYQLI